MSYVFVNDGVKILMNRLVNTTPSFKPPSKGVVGSGSPLPRPATQGSGVLTTERNGTGTLTTKAASGVIMQPKVNMFLESAEMFDDVTTDERNNTWYLVELNDGVFNNVMTHSNNFAVYTFTSSDGSRIIATSTVSGAGSSTDPYKVVFNKTLSGSKDYIITNRHTSGTTNDIRHRVMPRLFFNNTDIRLRGFEGGGGTPWLGFLTPDFATHTSGGNGYARTIRRINYRTGMLSDRKIPAITDRVLFDKTTASPEVVVDNCESLNGWSVLSGYTNTSFGLSTNTGNYPEGSSSIYLQGHFGTNATDVGIVKDYGSINLLHGEKFAIKFWVFWAINDYNTNDTVIQLTGTKNGVANSTQDIILDNNNLLIGQWKEFTVNTDMTALNSISIETGRNIALKIPAIRVDNFRIVSRVDSTTASSYNMDSGYPSYNATNKEAIMKYTVPTNQENKSLNEFGTINNDGDLLSHGIFKPFTKTNSQEFIVEERWVLDNAGPESKPSAIIVDNCDSLGSGSSAWQRIGSSTNGVLELSTNLKKQGTGSLKFRPTASTVPSGSDSNDFEYNKLFNNLELDVKSQMRFTFWAYAQTTAGSTYTGTGSLEFSGRNLQGVQIESDEVELWRYSLPPNVWKKFSIDTDIAALNTINAQFENVSGVQNSPSNVTFYIDDIQAEPL